MKLRDRIKMIALNLGVVDEVTIEAELEPKPEPPETDCSVAQKLSQEAYVAHVRYSREKARRNPLPPMTLEQEREHLEVVLLRKRVDAMNTSPERVEESTKAIHEPWWARRPK